MNVFGIGLPEMAVIAAIALLVFGPRRLPELGKTLGRTLRGFQSASQEFEQEFRNAIATEPESGLDSASAAKPAAIAPAVTASAAPAEPTGIDAAPVSGSPEQAAAASGAPSQATTPSA